LSKKIIFIAAILILVSGCSGKSKTKETQFEAGKKEAREKNYGAAVIHFKSALEKDLNYLDARFELGRVYALLGKYEAAEKELQKVLLQRPGSREARIELARAWAFGGKPEQALTLIRKAVSRAENAGDALEISGWAHAARGEYPIAEEELKRAAALQPDRTETLALLARLYLMMDMPAAARDVAYGIVQKEPAGRTWRYLLAETEALCKNAPKALALYEQIIDEGGDVSVYYRKGLLLGQLNRLDEALSVAETMLRKFPNRPEGYELKGLCLFRQKKYKEAISSLQKTQSLLENPRTAHMLAWCHYYNNELEQALKQVRRALALKPDLVQAHILASLVYLKQHEPDSAISEIRTVLASQESNAYAHSILGSALLEKRLYSEGLAELNRALELDPGLTEARVKKGVFQLSRGKQGEAEAELSAAVRSNPELLNTRLLLASYYLKQNESEKAIAAARKGLRNAKTDALLYNVIADACLRQQKNGEAMAALRQAMEADPECHYTYFKMAALHRIAGRTEKALAIIREAAEKVPGNAEAQLFAASAMETAGDREEARRFYERARKTGRLEGAVEAARYYLRNRNPDEALDLVDEALRKKPSIAVLYSIKGQAFIDLKQHEHALQAYEELAKVQPEEGMIAITNLYLSLHKPEKALDRVKRELKTHPERTDLHAELTKIYLAMGKSSEAEAHARRIIEREPEKAAGYLMLASVHEGRHEIEKAIETLRRAQAVADAKLPMMLGRLYALRKDYPAAFTAYKKAESLKSGHVSALFEQAATLQQMGKKAEAMAGYRRVLAVAQDHVPALNNLAYLSIENGGNLQSALQYAVRAYSLLPRSGEVQDTLGLVFLKSGKINEGLKTLKQAAMLAPDNPSIYYHLALALKEHKEPEAAAGYLQKSISLGDFPEADKAKKLLASLNGSPRSQVR
jgi:putative PEP-CTERM system TPR-repeat lipoprotein